MISGKKLKELRLIRNLTQKELAIKSGISDAAIRNYELGNRSPTKQQLDKIASALNCDPGAITDHNLYTNIDFYQIIFDLETNFTLRPYRDESGMSFLMSNSPEFNDFLKEWTIRKEELKSGEITQDEYFEWKINWPQTCDDCGKREPSKQWRNLYK